MQKTFVHRNTHLFLAYLLLYFFVHSVVLLLILRLVHGLGFGIAATASGTLAGAIVPSSRRGEGIGYYALSVTLSSAVGPFLSMFLYRTSGFYSLIWLFCLTFIYCLSRNFLHTC